MAWLHSFNSWCSLHIIQAWQLIVNWPTCFDQLTWPSYHHWTTKPVISKSCYLQYLSCGQGRPYCFTKTFTASHRLLSWSVIVQILLQLLQKLNDNFGFWHDKCIVIFNCPGMLISLFLIMNGHVFQSANEHKGIEVRSAPGNMVTN